MKSNQSRLETNIIVHYHRCQRTFIIIKKSYQVFEIQLTLIVSEDDVFLPRLFTPSMSEISIKYRN